MTLIEHQQDTAGCHLALSTALEHPTVSADPEILCAVARACKDYRDAVQQCGACNTAVLIHKDKKQWDISSFSCWLAKHGPLVRSISITHARPPKDHAVQQLLKALQAAAAAAATSSTASTATSSSPSAAAAAARKAGATSLAVAAQQQQQQQKPGMRLASFLCDLPHAPALLDALPAHSLTHLELQLQQEDPAVSGQAQAAALARLTRLHHLVLCGKMFSSTTPGRSLGGVAQLSRLTHLALRGGWKDVKRPLRLLLAQPLRLRELHLDLHLEKHMPVLDMHALQQLTGLTASKLQVGTILPVQLQELELGRWHAEHMPMLLPLQQLSRLNLHVVTSLQPKDMLCLTQLPALQHLAVTYGQGAQPWFTAGVWQHLVQLRELNLEFDSSGFGDIVSPAEMASVLKRLAVAASVTKLKLCALACVLLEHAYHEELERPRTAACASLAGLTGLKDLTIHEDSRLERGDALALTALTGLTRLVLAGLGDGVGADACAAMAASLTQLQHLDLAGCGS